MHRGTRMVQFIAAPEPFWSPDSQPPESAVR